MQDHIIVIGWDYIIAIGVAFVALLFSFRKPKSKKLLSLVIEKPLSDLTKSDFNYIGEMLRRMRSGRQRKEEPRTDAYLADQKPEVGHIRLGKPDENLTKKRAKQLQEAAEEAAEEAVAGDLEELEMKDLDKDPE